MRLTSRVRTSQRTILAAVVLLVAAGCTRPVVDAEVTPKDDVTASANDWPGIWPHETREEAQQAQAAADRGEEPWLLDPEWLSAVYGRDELGLDDVRIVDGPTDPDPDASGPLTFSVNGRTSLYPCDEGQGCDGVVKAVTVERLLRKDRTGIWTVTGAEPTSYWIMHPPTIPPPTTGDEARDFVVEFMRRRLHPSSASMGAPKLLGKVAAQRFDEHAGGLYLYGSPDGDPENEFVGFEVEKVYLWEPGRRPQWAVDVLLRQRPVDRGAATECEETLVVGPGENVYNEGLLLVVLDVWRGNCTTVAD